MTTKPMTTEAATKNLTDTLRRVLHELVDAIVEETARKIAPKLYAVPQPVPQQAQKALTKKEERAAFIDAQRTRHAREVSKEQWRAEEQGWRRCVYNPRNRGHLWNTESPALDVIAQPPDARKVKHERCPSHRPRKLRSV